MVMTGEMDWIFWTLGGLLGLTGLVLLLWALFADRSKGRKRCPKCWYNMAHTPSLTCSECGHTIKREKKLHKTRRRWRWAVIAVIFLIGSASTSLSPKVKREGWYSIIPTTVLILLVSEDDDLNVLNWINLAVGNWPKSTKPTEELGKRINDQSLWFWQWRVLAARIHPEDDASWIIHSYMRHDWPVGEPLYALTKYNLELSQRVWLGESELQIQVTSNSPSSGVWTYEFNSFYARWDREVIVNNSTFTEWNDWSFFVGNLNKGEHTIKLNVTLKRRDSTEDSWNTIWEGGVEHSVNIQGTIDDLLKPANNLRIENDLRSPNLHVTPDGVLVELPRIIDYNAWTTLALQFELINNGEVIRSTQAWWSLLDLAVISKAGFPMHERVAWGKPVTFIDSPENFNTTWALRVRAAPELALKASGFINQPSFMGIDINDLEIHLDGDFIPGEVTYKLLWIDAEQYWIVVD